MVLPAPTPPPCPFEKRFPSQLLRDDVFFMSLAYNQAIDAWRRDEVPIGCVIERDGEVLAMAHNTHRARRDARHHAGGLSHRRLAIGELHALRDQGTLPDVQRRHAYVAA
jgi:tRNA(Arg) A34 adenosine deaminase TadA